MKAQMVIQAEHLTKAITSEYPLGTSYSVILFELVVSIFAGYCCMYFLTDKVVGLTPAEFLEEFFDTLKNKLSNVSKREK